MMDWLTGVDAILLARMQFGFTVAFHFVFPSITIGLASFLAVTNALWLWRGEQGYRVIFDYWIKVFAVIFGMGVVSGIVMSYQFGTNWSVFSDRAGPVIGPLMAYEVLTAFFLEAGFLGIMLFGRDRVGAGLHMFACLMVALGTAISATWIIAVNSWMQTPQGYSIAANGQFVPDDWLAIIFNPSFPFRLMHVLTAAYLTTAFLVGGTGAFHLLRGEERNPAVRRMFSMAMWMAVLVAPVQVFLGDAHGLNTEEHQPAKVMAMEGHLQSYPDGAPLFLFGLPDQAAGVVRYAVAIPKLSSLILKHDPHAAMAGLDTIPPALQPPVLPVFFAFRVMVGIGFLMCGLGLWGLVARWRGRLYRTRLLHLAAVAMAPSGVIAVIAGWIVTEVGRQPYTIYGALLTRESASPLDAPVVALSLLGFIVVYVTVFGAGIAYVLRLLAAPPHRLDHGAEDEPGPTRAAGTTPVAQTLAQDASTGG